MAKKSAGLLAWRMSDGVPEVLLVHPGGPFFRKKDAGAWTIPKGELNDDEEPLTAAIREFAEELGAVAAGPFTELTPVRQKGGKTVYAWAMSSAFDSQTFTSNTFTIEWPPGTGNMQQFPEVDKAEWLPLPEARLKINPAQVALLDELEQKLLNS